MLCIAKQQRQQVEQQYNNNNTNDNACDCSRRNTVPATPCWLYSACPQLITSPFANAHTEWFAPALTLTTPPPTSQSRVLCVGARRVDAAPKPSCSNRLGMKMKKYNDRKSETGVKTRF